MHKHYDSDGSIQAHGTKLDGKRPGYARWHTKIDTAAQFYSTLRAGPYVWPGGYEAVFLCDDGGELCWACATKEVYNITWALHNRCSDGWRVTGVFLECDTDERIDCSHCSRTIKEEWNGPGVGTGEEKPTCYQCGAEHESIYHANMCGRCTGNE